MSATYFENGTRLSWSCNSSGSVPDRSASSFWLAPFETARSINARAKPAAIEGSAIAATPFVTCDHVFDAWHHVLFFTAGYAKIEYKRAKGKPQGLVATLSHVGD
jgi:hypothetical protein